MDPSQSFGAQGSRGLLKPSSTLSGEYELLGRLGTGGMAEVYLARAVGLDDFEKIVVLKRVLPERAKDRSYTAMFRDEARVAATLEHPNIVHTHDIGITDTECFFTMEYLHGEDIKAILAAARKIGEALPLELTLQIVVGCAAGLHHAHEQTAYAGNPLEIVHRDVSPSNIIVTRQNGVKLIDFGIAKATSDKEHTAVGVLKGKVSYMSPEQCRGETLDRRSDIFALGIVLYEMVTMNRPYQGENVLATVHNILEREPIAPQQLRPECPPMLEHVILKALHKDVNERYQTVFEMQEELELVARDCQLLALPGGLGRYLEHLFGPKPHPWTQRSEQPPAVPRWAWIDLDSTLTAPRETPTPNPVPGDNTSTDDTRMRDDVVDIGGYATVARPPPVAPARMPQVRHAPVTMARAPRHEAPDPQRQPTATSHSVAFPTSSHSVVHPTASHSMVLPTASRSVVLPTSSHSVIPPAPSHSMVVKSGTWAVKHLLVGGLVGGIIAVLGVTLWTRSETPRATPAAAAAAPVVIAPSVSVPTDPLAPVNPGEYAAGSESPPGVGATAGEGVANSGVDPPDAATDTAAPAPELAPSVNVAARVSRLLDRARGNLVKSPRQAYRDAKAAYDLKHSQTALQLMGYAGCRLKSDSKAKFAHRRLKGKTRKELENSCLGQGIDLR